MLQRKSGTNPKNMSEVIFEDRCWRDDDYGCSALTTQQRDQITAHDSAVTQQVDIMEAKLFAMVSDQQVQHTAEMRQVDKFVELSSRAIESRMDMLEQRVAQHETRITSLLQSLDERKAASVVEETKSTELRHGDAHSQRTEAAFDLPQHQASDSTGGKHEKPRSSRSEAFFLALQELESVVRTELRTVHKRCNTLQDLVDHQALASIADIEQKLQEQSSAVKQLVSAGQDCSSRVEEHEFRLGVARTKMEVHDEKISRLEARRMTQFLGSTETNGIPPRSPSAYLYRDVSSLSSSSATSKSERWQMNFHDNLAFSATNRVN